MTDNPMPREKAAPREGTWATPQGRLRVADVPAGGYSINIEGRALMSPLQGFGRLWRKVYRTSLEGCTVPATEVLQVWKERFPEFLPSFSAFYPSLSGLKAGEILYITAPLPIWPGSPGIIPLSTGVMILYVDDEMFTVMTPEGHPEAGWNTFHVFEEAGAVIAQVEGMVRASDPIYELGFRFMGGSTMSDRTWIHVLQSLAAHFGVSDREVAIHRECLDPSLQWRYARNVWRNAAIRTVFYMAGTPFRAIGKRVRGK